MWDLWVYRVSQSDSVSDLREWLLHEWRRWLRTLQYDRMPRMLKLSDLFKMWRSVELFFGGARMYWVQLNRLSWLQKPYSLLDLQHKIILFFKWKIMLKLLGSNNFLTCHNFHYPNRLFYLLVSKKINEQTSKYNILRLSGPIKTLNTWEKPTLLLYLFTKKSWHNYQLRTLLPFKMHFPMAQTKPILS